MDYLLQLADQLRKGSYAVLVVDDDPDIVSGMKDILENSGYIVQTAMYGADALIRLEQNVFSAMVCDYSLPDDNGVRVSEKARKMQPELSVILMTGHDPRHIRERIDHTQVDFMRKPVEVSILLAAVEAVIDRQCAFFKITRVITPILEEVGPAAAPPLQAVEAEIVAAPVLDLPDYPLLKRAWSYPIALTATALCAFSSGWVSRTAVAPNTKENPSAVSVMAEPSAHALASTVSAPSSEVVSAEPPVEKTVTEEKPPRRNLLAELEDPDEWTRIKAAKAILRSRPRHSKARKTLLAILDDPLSQQHQNTIEALSSLKLQDDETVAALSKSAEDADPSVAAAAQTALAHILPSTPNPDLDTATSVISRRIDITIDADTGLSDLPDHDAVQAAAAPAEDSPSVIR